MDDGKVLLITGASSGIGAATARRAAETGYRLVLGARRDLDRRPQNALADDDVARAVIFALTQPDHVDVNEVLIRPTTQAS